MFPLLVSISRRFNEQAGAEVQFTIQPGGSARGVADARSGLADIGMASRALTAAESDLTGFAIARDGVALIVNRANPIRALTDAQVAALYTGKLTNWKQVGGIDAPVHTITRDEGRSELEMFFEHFKLEAKSVHATKSLGDNQYVLEAVIEDADAIAFMSVGESERAAEHGKPVYILPVGRVAPTKETIRTGEYPLARQLTLVVHGAPSDLAAEFIRYCLSPSVSDLILERGFIPPASSAGAKGT